MPSAAKNRRPIAALLCGAACILAMPGIAEAKAKPPKFADTCLTARKPFSQIKNFQGSQIAKGAAVGLAGGLLLGLLNNAGKQNKSSVVPEMLAGAVAGGVVGYLGSLAQDQRNKDELRAAIDQDFAPSLGSYSNLPAQLQQLGQCRRDQIALVEAAPAAGTYDRAEAGKRLALIEKWVAEDDRVIAKAAGAQAKTVTQFAQANAVADGVDPTQAQQDGYAMSYYGLDAMGAQIAASNADVEARRFVNAASGARLRSAPSTSGAVTATIAHGAAVTTIGYPADGWAQVRTAAGETGYVSTSLLRSGAPGKAAPAVAAKPGKARVAKAREQQQAFAVAQQREKSATATRLAAARSLLAGA